MATFTKICFEESSSKIYTKCLVWSWLPLQWWVCLYHQPHNLGCSGSQGPAHESRDQQTHGAVAEAWLETIHCRSVPQHPQTPFSVPKHPCTSTPNHRLIPLLSCIIWGKLLQLLMWLLHPRSAQTSQPAENKDLNTPTLLSLAHSL